MKWERRYLQHDRVQVDERGLCLKPIGLSLSVDEKFVSPSQLLERWNSQHSMTQTMLSDRPHLFLQIDRNRYHSDETQGKLLTHVYLDAPIDVPVFAGDDLKLNLIPYMVVAVVLHFGSLDGGHYQYGLHYRLFGDDNRVPVLLQDFVIQHSNKVVGLWLTRADLYHQDPLPRQVNMTEFHSQVHRCLQDLRLYGLHRSQSAKWSGKDASSAEWWHSPWTPSCSTLSVMTRKM